MTLLQAAVEMVALVCLFLGLGGALRWAMADIAELWRQLAAQVRRKLASRVRR
ncbi:hypothetical protein L6R53_14080 [Myxococcota bacterium]|nr:hypothetical protein [Myxococcota bacterium]